MAAAPRWRRPSSAASRTSVVAPERREAQDAARLVHVLAADEVHDPPHLARRDPHVLGRCLALPRSYLTVLIRARLRGRACGTCAWARTRRACARPWTRMTNTGTCLRPSCTAMVCPTISGTTVERRDQVLMTRLSPRRFISTTFDHQVVVDERTLLDRTSAWLAPPLPAAANDLACPTPCSSCASGLPSCPTGCVGWRPPLDLPSPPPSGWSTGFMATPRTLGRLPQPAVAAGLAERDRARARRCRPRPTVALAGRPSTRRISPEGRRSVAVRALLRHQLDAGAGRTAPSWRRAPGFSSTACTHRADRDVRAAAARCRDGCRRRARTSSRSPTSRPCGARM